MANKNQPRIIGYDPNTGAPIYSNPSSSSNKAIKGVLIGIIVLVLGVAGWLVYDKFFNLEKVDLFAYDEEPKFSGYSGSGTLDYYIDEYYGDYKGEPMYAKEFYNSITYTPDKTEGLSNGDTITITASYDKKLAKKAKIKVKSDKKEYEVSGLTERYARDGSDIDPTDVAAMKSFMNDYMEREVSGYYGDYKSGGMQALFYISPETTDDYDDYQDQLSGVYKVTSTDSWDGSTEDEYIILTMKPINKGFDYKNKIDQLENDGELWLSVDRGYQSLNEAVNYIRTEFNRDKITDFDYS